LPVALGYGTFWSAVVLRSTSARADGAWSDSDTLLRRVDVGHLSSGGAIAQIGFGNLEAEGVQ